MSKKETKTPPVKINKQQLGIIIKELNSLLKSYTRRGLLIFDVYKNTYFWASELPDNEIEKGIADIPILTSMPIKSSQIHNLNIKGTHYVCILFKVTPLFVIGVITDLHPLLIGSIFIAFQNRFDSLKTKIDMLKE